jgi:hypothetical protein
MANDYNITGKWKPTTTGQVYIAEAVDAGGRVLASVEAHVPLEQGFLLEDYFGEEGMKSVERAAHATARDIAERALCVADAGERRATTA